MPIRNRLYGKPEAESHAVHAVSIEIGLALVAVKETTAHTDSYTIAADPEDAVVEVSHTFVAGQPIVAEVADLAIVVVLAAVVSASWINPYHRSDP